MDARSVSGWFMWVREKLRKALAFLDKKCIVHLQVSKEFHMFSLSSLFSSLAPAVDVVQSDLPAVSKTAVNVLALAAAVNPAHAETIGQLSNAVSTNTEAAASLVQLAHDHLANSTDTADALVGFGIDVLMKAQPQYAPFLFVAKPIITASLPVCESLLGFVLNHLHGVANTPVVVAPVVVATPTNAETSVTQAPAVEEQPTRVYSSGGDE